MMEYYAASKRKENLTNATWRKLEDVMLSEIMPDPEVQRLYDSAYMRYLW
jgi:hypothetical protein